MTLALVLVLGAVFALAWLMKRVRGFGSRVGRSVDVLAQVPLGQKERAVLVKVGPTQILIGVAPGRVNTLYVLPEPLAIDSTAGAAGGEGNSPFQALLKSLRK